MRGRTAARNDLEHDPEKWKPVFGKDHAQTEILNRMPTAGVKSVLGNFAAGLLPSPQPSPGRSRKHPSSAGEGFA
jgi:hypothetical protein